MAVRPSTVPTWNTSGTNRTAPSGGLRASGWALSQVPTSGVFNSEMNLYGAWCQYLNDGAMSGPFTFDDTVAIDGILTLISLAGASADKPLFVDATGAVKRGHASQPRSYTGLGAMLTAATVGANTLVAGATIGSVTNSAGSTAVYLKGIDGLPKGFRITAVRIRYIKVDTSTTAFNFFSPSAADFTTSTTNGAQTFTITLATPFTIADNTPVAVSVAVGAVGESLVGFDVIGDE